MWCPYVRSYNAAQFFINWKRNKRRSDLGLAPMTFLWFVSHFDRLTVERVRSLLHSLTIFMWSRCFISLNNPAANIHNSPPPSFQWNTKKCSEWLDLIKQISRWRCFQCVSCLLCELLLKWRVSEERGDTWKTEAEVSFLSWLHAFILPTTKKKEVCTLQISAYSTFQFAFAIWYSSNGMCWIRIFNSFPAPTATIVNLASTLGRHIC